MRPYYENDEDREAEWRIAEVVAERYGCLFTKLPIAYALDFSLHDGDGYISALLEAKYRDINFGIGDGLRIASLKIRHGLTLWKRFGRPAYLATEFRDGTMWITRFDQFRRNTLILWGRTDLWPQDDKAIEPCVSFPWENFRRIS